MRPVSRGKCQYERFVRAQRLSEVVLLPSGCHRVRLPTLDSLVALDMAAQQAQTIRSLVLIEPPAYWREGNVTESSAAEAFVRRRSLRERVAKR